MRRLIRTLGLCTAMVFLALPAMGDALGDAKTSGKIGEGPDGYLHAVEAGAEEKSLAKSIRQSKTCELLLHSLNVVLDAPDLERQAIRIEHTPRGIGIAIARLPD